MMLDFLLAAAALLVAAAVIFAVGVRVGSQYWRSEVQRTRFEAARAARQLHDLTRQAFVAMADHVERRDKPA